MQFGHFYSIPVLDISLAFDDPVLSQFFAKTLRIVNIIELLCMSVNKFHI